MDTKLKYRSLVAIYLVLLWIVVGNAMANDIAEPTETEAWRKLEEKAREAEKIREEKAAAAKAELELEIEKLALPDDTSPRFTVTQLLIRGNTLVSVEELLKNIPDVYNASDRPLDEAPSGSLFDLRALKTVVEVPGEPREVSTRTIQGFTEYLLSVYQRKGYGGIYVYVPAEAIVGENKLRDDVLIVEILEATVSDVAVSYFDPESKPIEEGYLSESALRKWSPATAGESVNKKKLDNFVNLLNLNPDRYISTVISRGAERETLAVGYNIYEASPWHWFIQADNSGTQDIEWAPRIGLINTNLLGIDDTFTAIYQAPWDSEITDNYSLYGSYDFPLCGPRLRLNLFGGYSEFDVNPDTGPINFLGKGLFYGGTLRFNVMQAGGWFFDVTGTLSHEESRVSPSLFPEFLESDVEMELWGWGLDFHRRDDMSDTSLTLNRIDSFGGSDPEEFALARTNANRDFSIYTTTARHSQYLDPNKVQRLSGTFRWTTSDERLVPAKMTTFGGMYTVRGYDESEIVADGGVLASLQYEFDLVANEKAKNRYVPESEQQEEPFLRKLAPLAFFDYGLARIENALATEDVDQELCSFGTGLTMDLGDNFTGSIYYGYPLISTDGTRTGKGRINVGLMMRW